MGCAFWVRTSNGTYNAKTRNVAQFTWIVAPQWVSRT